MRSSPVGADPRWKRLPALAASLLLVITLGAASGCGDDAASGTTRASTIDADASPHAVVREFLAAVARGDDDVARTRATPEYVERSEGAADSWFTNVERLSDIQVSTRVRIYDPGGGRLRSALEHNDVRLVSASYTLDQKAVVSQPDGPTSTTFVLVRDDPAEPWRIDDAGL